jgi:UDP-3-O-[3-hydroxymyristoyl] N-acetylglucosamine deacetylase
MWRSSEGVVLEGRGLHTGAAARVVLRTRSGALCFRTERDVPLREARVVETDRATTIEIDDRRVATVEHLLAAFGGLGVHQGVSIEVLGPELPLLDGGARSYCEALRELGAEGGRGEMEVARDGEVRVGGSSYTFERGDAPRLHVTIDFPDAPLGREAHWDGDPGDFVQRIAPARTFAFASEVLELARRGLASHVTPESVVVVGEREVLSSGHPFVPDEPARHKLLDLVGDLFLYGGPPRGTVRAHRPGHGANRAALEEAFERQIVRRVPVISSAGDG